MHTTLLTMTKNAHAPKSQCLVATWHTDWMLVTCTSVCE